MESIVFMACVGFGAFIGTLIGLAIINLMKW